MPACSVVVAGEGAASWWPAGWCLSPGCLQDIWTVHIGDPLLNVRWFHRVLQGLGNYRVDEAWGRVCRCTVLAHRHPQGAQLQACTLPTTLEDEW